MIVKGSKLWAYEWDSCSDDEQYDHILDSARDHNIAFWIDEEHETTIFIAEQYMLTPWLISFDVYDYSDVNQLHYVID